MEFTEDIQIKEKIADNVVSMRVSVANNTIVASCTKKEGTGDNASNVTLQVTKTAQDVCISSLHNTTDLEAWSSIHAAIKAWLLNQGVALIGSLKALVS
jgi:hypothetical protein